MTSEAAKRYAKALYQVATEVNKNEKILLELKALEQAIRGDQEVYSFLSSAVVSGESKRELIEKAMFGKISNELYNTLLLLVDKNRTALILEISTAYQDFSDQNLGISRGVVRTAASVGSEEKKKIEESVSSITKKKVILSFEEDKTLLGGMTAQVGGWGFDDSLASHLKRMSEELNRRSH